MFLSVFSAPKERRRFQSNREKTIIEKEEMVDDKSSSSKGLKTDITDLCIRESNEGVEASFLIVSPGGGGSSVTNNSSDDVENNQDKKQSCRLEDGKWICRPYKREVLLDDIVSANKKGAKGHAAILNTLKSNGIRIFVIDSMASSSISEIMNSIHSVISHVTSLDRSRPVLDYKRCLLYRDNEGRFFNLTLYGYTTASESTFRSLLDSFSGFQAMCALLILCRAFACATEPSTITEQFRPAYLGLLLGLVFVEEISYSWINVAMFVRGIPSISAYAITTNVASDWLRKILVFCLTLGAATTGRTQLVLTLFGISLACAVLLANLGSRSWAFLRWKPLAYSGPLEPVVAYGAAILAGALVPYMGHRQIEAGGKPAMESVIRTAFLVAVVFVVSDYDEFQKFLVIGSENCNQDVVNIIIGGWWTVSLLVCLVLVLRVEPARVYPEEEEPLLEEDHSSPLGYRVPNLPDFPVNPNLALKGILPCPVWFSFALGVIMAVGVGGCMVFLAFTNFDEDIGRTIDTEVDGIV